MLKKVNISDLQEGEIKHPILPDWFIERVQAFKAKLAEVESNSVEATINNFKRDTNPERELVVWEHIANTYATFVSQNNIQDYMTKRDVLSALLGLSMGSDDFSNIKLLTPDQIKVLVYNYRGV